MPIQALELQRLAGRRRQGFVGRVAGSPWGAQLVSVRFSRERVSEQAVDLLSSGCPNLRRLCVREAPYLYGMQRAQLGGRGQTAPVAYDVVTRLRRLPEPQITSSK